MPRLSEELFQDLLDLLGDHELAERLRAEQLAPRQNSAECCVTIDVPLRFVSHVASALHVGATTSKMCDESMGSVEFQRAAARMFDAEIPNCFKAFLHRSDVTKIYDIIAGGGDYRILRSWNEEPKDIEFIVAGSGRVRSFSFSREGKEVASKPGFWEALEAALKDLKERLPSRRLVREEPVDGAGPSPD